VTNKEYKRRNAILSTLSFEPLATVSRLRHDLETVHGIAASADRVRADLDFLADVGLVRVDGDAARCTERGMDVARLRANFPGRVD
jgi:hypothetical protein